MAEAMARTGAKVRSRAKMVAPAGVMAEVMAAAIIVDRLKTEMTQPTTEAAAEVAAREAIYHGLEMEAAAIKALYMFV